MRLVLGIFLVALLAVAAVDAYATDYTVNIDGTTYAVGVTGGLTYTNLNVYNVKAAAYGAVGDGVTDDSAAIQAAADAAAASWSRTAPSGVTAGNMPVVYLPGPGTYYIGTQITIDDATSYTLPIAFVSDGGAVVKGDGAIKGLVFDNCVVGHIEGLVFWNFTTAVEFDTGNQAAGRWVFKNVEFYECDVGIDSKSYADSRSTNLMIDGLRGNLTDVFLKSYCDVLTVRNAFVRNNQSTQGSFLVDSRASFEDCIFVPVSADSNGRWIDFGPTTDDVRWLTLKNCRFSGELGGLTAVYNFIQGEDSTRNAAGISFDSCYLSVGNGGSDDDGGAVVLATAPGDTTSYTPNVISFRYSAFNSVTTEIAVLTEEGHPIVNPSAVPLLIEADEPSMMIATANLTNGYTFVEDILEASLSKVAASYLFGERTATADDVTPDVRGTKVLSLPANTGATAITQFDNGDYGQVLAVAGTSATNSATISDGGNFVLRAATWTAGVDSVITLITTNGTTWREISR